jgi:hypothetical protein
MSRHTYKKSKLQLCRIKAGMDGSLCVTSATSLSILFPVCILGRSDPPRTGWTCSLVFVACMSLFFIYNFESRHHKDDSDKFGWNWPSGFRGEDIGCLSQTDRNQVIAKAHLTLLVSLAKKNFQIFVCWHDIRVCIHVCILKMTTSI